MYLYIDTETYSHAPISVGTYRYAETAQIMLITWAIDDGPVQIWDHNDGVPAPDFAAFVHENPGMVVVAHNAMFDRTVLRLGDLCQDIPVDRWTCTMVQALSHALPGSLDKLGEVLGLPTDQQKLKSGKQLIQRFCKPAPKNHRVDRYTAATHPAEWARFREYAVMDVEATREIHHRLPTWNWSEHDRALWHMDQRINDAGFAVDRVLAAAGAAASEAEKVRTAERFQALTLPGLKPTQRERVRVYLNSRYGLELDRTAKEIIAPIEKDESQPAELRETIRLILSANKTSTAKYSTMLSACSTDGRFRGGLQYAGAARTRRWAGRVFQPQNLPSRGIPSEKWIETYICALKAGIHTEVIPGDQQLFASAALRGLVIAPPGKKLCVSDLSNIEGRVLAWLAGEVWKLQAFRDYDVGEGPDLYNVTAVSIIGGDPYTLPKKHRNVFGKVPDLAGGFRGGAGAYDNFCRAYGVMMMDYWDVIQANVDPRHIEKARWGLENWGRAFGIGDISEEEWIARETLKNAWRYRHPAICQLWTDTEAAIDSALDYPGRWFQSGPLCRTGVVVHNGARWLLIYLPSGRYLTYYDFRREDRGYSYMGLSSEKRNGAPLWERIYTHGGKIVENETQAVAGDYLRDRMPDILAAGYEVNLTVHDEVATETPDLPEYSADRLSELLAAGTDWSVGLPLAAAGFEAYRYKKED